MKLGQKSLIVIFMLPLLLLYQNCSCTASHDFNGGANLASGMESTTSGNGQPYEGKPEPGTYYRLVPEFKCGDRPRIYASIEVESGVAKLRTTNPQNCSDTEQILDAAEAESAVYNKSFLGHASGIYEKMEAPPILDGPEVVYTESWCRVENPGSRTLDVVVKETLPNGKVTVTLIGAARSPSGPVTKEPERTLDGVIRRIENGKLIYSSDGFTLDIDLQNAVTAAPGKFRAQLSLQESGTTSSRSRQETLLCRTGAKLDERSTIRPSLALDLSAGPLPASITFARPTSASYYDAKGVLKYASPGEPRFEFDPITLEARGLLVETAAVNLLSNSNNLSDAFFLQATRTSNAATAPDMTTTALRLTEAASGASVVHQAGYNVSLNPNTLYTVSYFAKAGSRPATEIGITNRAGALDPISFNLLTGNMIDGPNNSAIKAAGSQSVGNGWFRVWVTFDSGSGATQPIVSMRPHLGTSPFGGMYSGDGTSYIDLWGVQLEAGEVSTSYIQTQAGPGTREADIVTLNSFTWFNAGEGAFMVQVGKFFYGTVSSTLQPNIFHLAGPAANDFYSLASSTNPVLQFTATFSAQSAGSSQIQSLGGSTPNTSTQHKIALAYRSGDSALIAFGSAQSAAANAPVGFAPSAFHFGGLSSQTRWNGHFKALTYWPNRIPNDSLLNLTRE